MAMSEQRAKDLAAIEPPPSVDRISSFLRDLTRDGGIAPTARPTLGSGLAIQSLASDLAARHSAMPAFGFLEAFQRLMEHYAVQASELEAFARWLVVWNEKRNEMEVIADPRFEPPPPSVEPFDVAPRRVKRRGDAPRPVPARPLAIETSIEEAAARPASEAAARPTPGRTNPKVQHRPAKRPEVPVEAAEPAVVPNAPAPRRIDLAAIAKRAQPLSIGAGMMLGGAVVGGSAHAVELARTAGFLPPEVHTTVRSLFIDSPRPSAPRTIAPHEVASRSVPVGPPSPGAGGYGPPSTGVVPSPEPPIPPEASATEVGPGEERWPMPPSRPVVRIPAQEAPTSPEYGSEEMGSLPPRIPQPPPTPGVDPVAVPQGSTPGGGSMGAILGGVAAAGLLAAVLAHRGGDAATPPPPPPPDKPTDPVPPGGDDAAAPSGSVDDPDAAPGTGKHQRKPRPFASRWLDPRLVVRGAGGVPRPLVRAVEPNSEPAEPAKAKPAWTGDPRYAQITLFAPPVRVASERSAQSGSAVRFDWVELASGAGELDAAGLSGLTAMLPQGAQALYPALPEGSLGDGGVNLRLGPGLLTDLVERGYGPEAAQEVRRTARASGAMPAGRPLAASLVPLGRPTTEAAQGGVLGEAADRQMGGLAEAGGGQAKRGGALDFLGVPVRLAPNLSGRSELRDEVTAREAAKDLSQGKAVRPEAFAPLRERLFPGLQSVSVEPDRAAWRQAAPSFGMRGDDPASVLAPDLLPPAQNPSAGPKPPSEAPVTAPRLPLSTPTSKFSDVWGSAPRAGDAPGSLGIGHRPSSFRPLALAEGTTAGEGFVPRMPHPAWQAPTGSGPSSASSAVAPRSTPSVPRLPVSETTATAGVEAGSPGPTRMSFPPARASGRPHSPPTFEPLISQSADIGGSAIPSVPSLAPSAVPSDLPARALSRPSAIRPISVSVPSVPRWEGVAPDMLFTPSAPRPGRPPAAIQRSTGGSVSIPERPKMPSAAPDPKSGPNERNDAGEINSLATEVWSLLKRRFANEAERRGRW